MRNVTIYHDCYFSLICMFYWSNISVDLMFILIWLIDKTYCVSPSENGNVFVLLKTWDSFGKVENCTSTLKIIHFDLIIWQHFMLKRSLGFLFLYNFLNQLGIFPKKKVSNVFWHFFRRKLRPYLNTLLCVILWKWNRTFKYRRYFLF